MPSVLFRGAHIRYADIRQESEAGKFVRIHFTADYSKPVREHMGWDELPPKTDSAKLAGELTGKNLTLTPNGRELRWHEISLDIAECSDFQVFRVKGEDGESSHVELRFIVRSRQTGAAAIVEAYFEVIGEGDGVLKITHEKQEGLFDGDTQDDSQPVLTDDETGEVILAGEAAQQHAALASKRQVEIADNGGKPPAKPRAPRGPQVVN